MQWAFSRQLFGIALFFAVSALFSTPAIAQIPLSGAGVSLRVSPEFPGPETAVEVSLNDSTVNTVGMTVSWYIAGVLDASLENARSIRVTTGELGKSVPVRAVLSRGSSPVFEALADITPTQVDLIIEADTYVPSFYRGRALPSPESSARAIAVVNDGTGAPASSYTYTWLLDGSVLFGGPVKGKRAIDLSVSRFEGSTLEVRVANAGGVTVGRSGAGLKATEPRLLFYEQSPLRGLLERAITGRLPLIGNSVTVYGEPYFLHTSPSSERADFSWDIGGSPVNTTSGAPNAITLEQVGAGGEATVNLRVVSRERIPQVVEKAFKVFFE